MKIILTIFLFVPQAFAVGVCHSVLDGDKLSISIKKSGEKYKTSVSFKGEELEAVGPCWREDRPSTRHIRCSHANDEYRVEVYPWAQLASGKEIGPRAILWHGTDVSPLELDCD